MKKLLTILVTLLMLFALCACNNKEEAENIGMANPMVEYSSLEEINEQVGVHLIKPGVMGVTNEKYFVIDGKIAEYDFEVNGGKYCLRASSVLEDDISGVYLGEKTMFEDVDTKTTFYSDDTYNGFRCLLDNGHQYTLVTSDGSVETDIFNEVANEMYDLICGEESDPEIKALIGNYQDSTSQRATATVEAMGYNCLLMDIIWSSSANESDEWMMMLTYDDGKLTYSDDEISHSHYQNEEVVILHDAIGGYLEVQDGKLLWTGANQDNLKDCVFEKID